MGEPLTDERLRDYAAWAYSLERTSRPAAAEVVRALIAEVERLRAAERELATLQAEKVRANVFRAVGPDGHWMTTETGPKRFRDRSRAEAAYRKAAGFPDAAGEAKG